MYPCALLCLQTSRALKVLVVLLSMQGKKGLGFHQKLLCVPKMKTVLMGLERDDDD